MSIIIDYLLFVIILFPSRNFTNTNGLISDSDSTEVTKDFLSYSQPIPGSEQSSEMITTSCGDFKEGSLKNFRTKKGYLNPFWIDKSEITWHQDDMSVKKNVTALDLSNSILKTQSAVRAGVFLFPFPQYMLI